MKYKGIILSLLLLAVAFGAAYLAPAFIYADTAQLNIPQATSSGNLIVGEGKSIRSQVGPVRIDYKSGPDTYATGIFIKDFDGNVGIGTTSPASKFHLMRSDAGATGQRFSDAAIFENNGNSYIQIIGSEAGEKSINFASPSNGADGAIKYNQGTVTDGFQFVVNNNSTTAMTLASSGNVGIGTTGPTEKLVVGEDLGNIGTGTHIAVGDSSANVPGIGIGFNNTNRVALSWSGGENGFFSLGTSTTAGGGLWAKFVLKDGNVGIGTTGPLATLDVAGSASMSGTLTVGNGGTIRPQYGPLTLAYKSALNSWTTGITLQDTTGNVGIGTTGPESNLHVQTVSNTTTNFLILEGDRNITDTEVGILFKDRSAIASGQEVSRIWTERQGVTGNFDLVFQAGDQTLGGLQTAGGIRIQGDTGNVGIGTTGPGYLLDVNGIANMTTLSIGGTAVTATAAELNYTGGVTSAIQTQITAKQGLNQGVANVLTIAAGEVTLVDNESYYAIATEASAATDDLDYINGGSTGDIIILRAANDARDVVLIDSTVLRLAGNMTLDSNSDTITLMRLTSTVWVEIARSNNF